jgi:hypothetical protein
LYQGTASAGPEKSCETARFSRWQGAAHGQSTESRTGRAELSADELAIFREWFVAFKAENWDCRFERDAQAGLSTSP